MSVDRRPARRRAAETASAAIFSIFSILAGFELFAVFATLAAAVLPASVATAAEGSPEPARVRLAGALVDETIKGLLPAWMSLAPPAGPIPDAGTAPTPTVIAAGIVDVRYCGASEPGRGRLRAVLQLTGVPAAAVAPGALGSDGDCRLPLGDLGKRLTPTIGKADGALVVAELEATWRPWELRVTVTRFVFVGEPQGPAAPLRAAFTEGRRELLVLPTAGVTVPTEFGPLVFHVAPSFLADAVELIAIVGEAGTAAPPSRLHMPAMAQPDDGGPSDGANTAIDLPYTLANHLLRRFAGARPLPVRMGRETVDVQNLSLWGTAGGGVTIVGTATSRAMPESARVRVTASGSDLRVGTIRADAQLESCAGLGVIASLACNARNAARNAAAAALGVTATDRYQGQLLKDLAGRQELRYEVGHRTLRLTGQLQRIVAGPRGLSVAARFAPGDQSGSSP